MLRFFHWPLTDQIVVVGFILSLICFLGSRFVDRPEDHEASLTGGLFRMRPLRSSAAIGLSVILFEASLAFGLVSEGQMYWLAEILTGCTMVAATGGAFYAVYLVRYSFNAAEFVATDSLLRRTQRSPWSSFDELGVRTDGPYFKLAGKRFPLPSGRSGRKQLVALIDSKILRLTAPIAPLYNERELQKFTGKSVRVNLMQVDEAFHARVVRSNVGTITAAGANEVSITFDDGSRLQAAGNLRSFSRTSGEPELLASWYVEP